MAQVHCFLTGRCCISFVLVTLLCTTGLAEFTEKFEPANDSSDAKALLPGLWQQIGGLYKGGRGSATSGDNKYSMRLDSSTPTAETDLLKWDGSNKPLDFYYFNTETCDTGVLKVSLSCNAKDWTDIWSMKVANMQVNAYNAVRVPLPLNSSCTTYAVRWDFTRGTTCYSSQNIYIDDITFPAHAPGKATDTTVNTPPQGGGEGSTSVYKAQKGTAEKKTSTAAPATNNAPAASAPMNTAIAGSGGSSTLVFKNAACQPVVSCKLVAGGLCLLLALLV